MVAGLVAKVKSYKNKLGNNLNSTADSHMTPAEFMKQKVKQYAANMMAYLAMGSPDAMVGFVPLYCVQHYEYASSEDILKFRAVGAQFLAHQRGNNFSFRLDAVLSGTSALTTLTLLQTVFRYGSGSEKLTEGVIPQNSAGFNPLVHNISNQAPTTSESTMIQNDNMQVVSPHDFSWMKSVYHKTFTIIVKEAVYFGMYIESLIYWVAIDEDPNIIHISLLIRKFVPPPRIMSSQLYSLDMAQATNMGKINPNYDGTKLHYLPAATTYQKTMRMVATHNEYPANFQQIENIISLLHSSFTSSVYSVGTVENLRSRQVRDNGIVYRALTSGNNAIIKAASKGARNVVTSMSNETSIGTTSTGKEFMSKTLYDIKTGNMYLLRSPDSVVPFSKKKQTLSISAEPVNLGNGVRGVIAEEGSRYILIYGSKQYYIKKDTYYIIRVGADHRHIRTNHCIIIAYVEDNISYYNTYLYLGFTRSV